MSPYLASLAHADISLTAAFTYSAVFACTVLIGAWAMVDMPRLIAVARSGEVR